MNRTIVPAVLALAAAAPLAMAQFETQSFTYEWNSDLVQHDFEFAPFDDQGGTRALTGVRLGFSGVLSLRALASTTDPAGVPAGDWSAELSHTVVAYFHHPKGGTLDLLQGIGGQVADFATGDIPPGQDGEFGEPLALFFSWDFAAEVAIDESFFADFSSAGTLPGFMDAFFDGVVTPPEGGQFVNLVPSLLSQAGTVTLTYEYAPVPTPGTLTLLGAGGLVVCRRRRR